jgi:predicted dehydrogenase
LKAIAKEAKIHVGIVGLGNWGRYGHIPVLQLLPNFEVVAVASRRKEYAQATAKRFSIALVYLYAAYANDRVQGTHDAPTFADAGANAPADRTHRGSIINWCTPTR